MAKTGGMMNRAMRVGSLLFVMALCFAGRAQAQGTPVAGTVSVTGKLVKVMAIGAETSGWAIDLDTEGSFGGTPMKTIEVEGKAKKFEKLENLKVTASGTIVHKQGVEAHDRIVLQVAKIKEWKPKTVSQN
jgi:hypothetical protein